MHIQEYRQKVLKKHNKWIDLFLLLFISLTITGLIFVGMSESMIKHFEDRSDVIAGDITSFLSDNSEELLAGQTQGDNLCKTFNFSLLDDASKQVIQDRCAEGPITMADIPPELIQEQIISHNRNLKSEVKTRFDEQIAMKKDSLENMEKKYPFLNMYLLNVIFSVLLVLYLVNNDLVITIHYLARKLVFLVPVLFILPYFLFRLNVLSSFINGESFGNLVQTPIPINTVMIVDKVVALMSSEMTLFYEQFLLYAVLGLFVGLMLWFINEHYLLPMFAKKHNIWVEPLKKKK